MYNFDDVMSRLRRSRRKDRFSYRREVIIYEDLSTYQTLRIEEQK